MQRLEVHRRFCLEADEVRQEKSDPRTARPRVGDDKCIVFADSKPLRAGTATKSKPCVFEPCYHQQETSLSFTCVFNGESELADRAKIWWVKGSQTLVLVTSGGAYLLGNVTQVIHV